MDVEMRIYRESSRTDQIIFNKLILNIKEIKTSLRNKNSQKNQKVVQLKKWMKNTQILTSSLCLNSNIFLKSLILNPDLIVYAKLYRCLISLAEFNNRKLSK